MIKQVPNTRISLIVRLADVGDACAWEEFVAIYEDFIYRFGRRRGLQHSDAQELTQNVLIGVSKAIRKWRPDSNRAKFRTWLFRIAQNQFANQIRKKSIELNVEAPIWGRIESNRFKNSCDVNDEDSVEFFKTKMKWAFEIVKQQVHEQTWEAFRLSYMENLPVKEIAASMEIKPGQVYVSRSRVIKKLKHELALLETVGIEIE